MPTIVGGVPAIGAPCGKAAIVKGTTDGPLARSASLQRATPGTCLQSVHCQNVQPSPPQFAAGTEGAEPPVQWAIHRRNPVPANIVVSPSELFQKLGEAYTRALTPVRASTSPSHACVHCRSRLGPSPPVASRSSTGGRSPAFGCATATKWSACAIALAVAAAFVVPAGRAKW